MARINRDEQKQWAKDLFLKGVSQVEIAERTKVSKVTINRWVQDGNWKKLKFSITMSRQEQLAALRDQLAEINKVIKDREEGERYPSRKEQLTQKGLIADIGTIEGEVQDVPPTISVMTRFLDWLRVADVETARNFSDYMDAYINELLNQ